MTRCDRKRGGGGGELLALLLWAATSRAQPQELCSHGFCVTPDYRKLELPPPGETKVVEVTLTPHVLEIFEVNDKQSSITLSMYLGVKWEDSRIVNMNETVEDLQGVGFSFLSLLWQPDIEIHHVRSIKEPKVMGQFVAGLQINRGARREVLYSQVVMVTVTCPMRFLTYPFDKHVCPFLFGSYTYDHTFMVFHTDDTFITTVLQQNTNLDYDISFSRPSHADSSSTQHQRNQSIFIYDNGQLGHLSLTGFTVDITRHYSKYLIVYYLPSGLFVLVSWTSFIIPPEVVAGRMGLLITILLCLVNIFNVINNNSPSVKGVTALSVWVLTCIVFVFSAVVAYTGILSKSLIMFVSYRFLSGPKPSDLHERRKSEDSPFKIIMTSSYYREADIFFLLLFPSTFFIFNAIYWNIYLYL